jgi:hypothetical protein
MNTKNHSPIELEKFIKTKQDRVQNLESSFLISMSMQKASEIIYLKREILTLNQELEEKKILEGLNEQSREMKLKEMEMEKMDRGLLAFFEIMSKQ